MIQDKHGRTINYLRVGLTDRCNLRCFYCMPESGIKYVSRKELLSFEELHRLISLLSEAGITKVRFTGGEPFLRNGIMDFLRSISKLDRIKEIHLTTNGTFIRQYIPYLKKAGITSINLSLDSLDRKRFLDITRRDLLPDVLHTYKELLATGIPTKTNMVVMDGRNTQDIYPMIELTRYDPVSVRFIEEMPFNGTAGKGNSSIWPSKRILEHIQKRYSIEKLPDPPSSTSQNFKVSKFNGSFGIIAAYTRTFCGSCNRIRITPQGAFKTCLYDGAAHSIRDFMRLGVTDEELLEFIRQVIQHKPINGFVAEKNRKSIQPVSESMATIGG